MKKSILLAILLFVMAFLFTGCGLFAKEKAPEPITRRIHLLNPWQAEGVSPFIHGGNIKVGDLTWQKKLMVQEDPCGWYSYEFEGTTLGQFRFMKGLGWDICFGPRGLACSELTNFQVDMYLVDSTDVYIASDAATGLPSVTTYKPVLAGCSGGDAPEKPAAGLAKYPFPQEAIYPGGGIRPAFATWSQAQSLYDLWRAQYLETSGNLARVKFDDPTLTVSEGIGYGMLISVFADNAVNNSKADFDNLWNYYQLFSNPGTGLMDWKISGFTTVAQAGAATDAELDVALALAMAYKQWDDIAYLNAAIALSRNILLWEVDASGYLKPGGDWDAAKNPSYISIVAFEAFAAIDPTNAATWQAMTTRHLQLLQSASNSTTGLVPNWSDVSGSPVDPGNGYGATYGQFGFDAVRVPWRAAWAYLWLGNLDAQAIASKLANWSNGACGGDPSLIRDLYELDGTSPRTYTGGPAFTGAFAVAAMVDPTQQAWLNQLWAQLRTQTGGDNNTYYHSTMQVLYAFLITGNMPNLLALP